MQKWEYLTVDAKRTLTDGTYKPLYVNGKDQGDMSKLPTIYEYINELGGKGWELEFYFPEDHKYIFKRPKE